MAFIITKDHIAEPSAKEGTNANAKGVIGPRSYKGDGSELKTKFRMLDDDREVCYEGRWDGDDPLEPLDCFGMPNAGCTILQHRENGNWVDV